MSNIKIEFIDLDKTKFLGYSRIHHGVLKIDKLKFTFVVYEILIKDVKYHTFDCVFTEGYPQNNKDYQTKIIDELKNKLNIK